MLTKSIQNKRALTWDDVPGLKLSPHLLAGLNSLGFNGPRPVQAATIPLFLNHKDVCVEAITGSGKTLAFVLPILETLYSTQNLKKYEVRAIILTPTQELARQIYDVITQNFTLPHVTPQVTCQLFTGGARSPSSDLARFALQGGHVIVATPGRLEWLLGSAAPPIAVGGEGDTPRVMTSFARCVSSCDILVLDEADRLLDMGLSDTISVIIGHLPKQRRTCLFSATLNEKVDCLIKAGLRNPISVVVKESPTSNNGGQNLSTTTHTARTPASLSCFYALCRPELKFTLLLDLLHSHPVLAQSKKTMVFMSSLFAAQYFAKALKLYIGRLEQQQGCGSGLANLEVLLIHRKMRSNDRATVLARFKDAKLQEAPKVEPPSATKRLVLMCTDVVARGIDIPDVDWVIHFDAPCSIERFLHRSGRTARSERLGNALLMLLPNEAPFIEFLALNRGLVVGPLSQTPPNLGEKENLPENRVLEMVRETALRDRAYMLKGVKAFVSYIRAYAQHQCRLIFRLKDLDLGACARGYALLYLPKMPEVSQQMRRETKLKGPVQPEPAKSSARLASFEPPYPDLNPKDIPYADPELEKSRLVKLDLDLRARRAKKASEIKEQKRRAIVSKIKNKTSRDSHKLTRRERSKIKQTLDARDIAEIGKDAKMLKKLKNKKITESAFDKAFYAGL